VLAAAPGLHPLQRIDTAVSAILRFASLSTIRRIYFSWELGFRLRPQIGYVLEGDPDRLPTPRSKVDDSIGIIGDERRFRLCAKREFPIVGIREHDEFENGG